MGQRLDARTYRSFPEGVEFGEIKDALEDDLGRPLLGLHVTLHEKQLALRQGVPAAGSAAEGGLGFVHAGGLVWRTCRRRPPHERRRGTEVVLGEPISGSQDLQLLESDGQRPLRA